MAEITQDDRAIIAEYPLDDTLNHLLRVLHNAEQFFKSNKNHDEATDASDSRLQNAPSRLLAALVGHQVAYNIRHKLRMEARVSRNPVECALTNMCS